MAFIIKLYPPRYNDINGINAVITLAMVDDPAYISIFLSLHLLIY